MAAPTRQGKGAGVVIPNLLNYPDSVVVLDIKLENYQLTSLFRQIHGQKVFLFNPFAEDGRTHRWNPMDAIGATRIFGSWMQCQSVKCSTRDRTMIAECGMTLPAICSWDSPYT